MASKQLGKNQHIIIVISKFNPKITERLLKGAVDAFSHYKGLESDLEIYRVPGAFEIPGTIQQILYHKKSHAIVALGSVIRGETPHFDFISKPSTDAIMKLSIENKKPIGNGIITCLNMKQAIARKNNKGKEAANAVNSVLDELELDDKDMLVDFE